MARKQLGVDPSNDEDAVRLSDLIAVSLKIGNEVIDAENNRLLATDDSGLLTDSHFGIDDLSYFEGAVVGKRLFSPGLTNPVSLELLNLSGVGQPNALGVTVNNNSGSFYFIDVSTLTPYMALTFDHDEPENSSFAVGLASGVASSPEFRVSTSGVFIGAPLDVGDNKITSLTPGADTGEAVEYDQMNTAISDAISEIEPEIVVPGADGDILFNTTDELSVDTGVFKYNPSSNLLTIGAASAQGGILLPDVSKNSYVAIGPQGVYGPSMVLGEPHIAINTVRMIGDGGGSLIIRDHNNGAAGLNVSNLRVNNFQTPGNGIVAFSIQETFNNQASVANFSRTDTQNISSPVARLFVRPETGLISQAAGVDGIRVKAQTSQTGRQIRVVDGSNNELWSVDIGGAMKPASMADSAASNDRVYYSTDAGKLVYKDSSGTVNPLY